MGRPYNSPESSQKARPVPVIRTCKHIKDNGALCQAVVQKSSAYCPAHLQLQARTRKMARAGRAASRVKLPLLGDMQAVQVASVRVQVALEAGHIDEGRARLMRWGLRMLATTFRHMEKLEEKQPSLASKARLPDAPHKSNNLYQMPINIMNSRALK